MTTEAGHLVEAGDHNVGWFREQIENLARALITEYRSKETVMGRTHGAHWGVASGVAEQMRKGESFVAAVAAVFEVHPRSAEAVRISSLLILGGFLELLYREFPSLQRSGVALGILAAIIFACHDENDTKGKSNDDEEEEEEEDYSQYIPDYENYCRQCGGTGRALDHKGRNGYCIPCKGTGRGNRKYIGD